MDMSKADYRTKEFVEMICTYAKANVKKNRPIYSITIIININYCTIEEDHKKCSSMNLM